MLARRSSSPWPAAVTRLGVIEQSDSVVVLGHTELAKGERSERLPVMHIWRYCGDEEICRLQVLTDTLQSGIA